MSILIVAAVFAVFSASAGDFPFAMVFLLGAGAGAIELHGVALLQQGERRGLNWLIASQPLLLVIVWSYCGLRLTQTAQEPIPPLLHELLAMSAQQAGTTPEAYWRFMLRLTMGVLAAASLAYQTGMAVYYLRRRQAVTRALAVD